jgi:uncharacterized surface protein with fasciclin (FAS1) repeats
MKNLSRILLTAVLVLTVAGGALAGDMGKTAAAKAAAGKVAKPMDIVDTAVAAGSFKTLVTAVQAAGLVETLKGAGPFTVFAPTDEAFAKLPKGTVEALLADKAKLTAVLTYHVVSGKVMAADALKLAEVTTVQGGKALIDAKAVTIDGAKIVTTDIVCTNGVIHVIDAVMLP